MAFPSALSLLIKQGLTRIRLNSPGPGVVVVTGAAVIMADAVVKVAAAVMAGAITAVSGKAMKKLHLPFFPQQVALRMA